MKTLNRDDILKVPDLVAEPVHAWGGIVYVRGMTGTERDHFEGSVVNQKNGQQTVNMDDIRAKLCVVCICDENGNRLFTDDDVELLSKKSGKELNRIFGVAQRLSGITTEEVEKLGEGLKNPLGDSASG